MTKAELVSAIAQNANLTKSQAREALEAFVGAVTTSLKKGAEVRLVGFGMGGSLALRFACQRKRLRAAVVFYGKVGNSRPLLKDLYCPVLYHQAGKDTWAGFEDVEALNSAVSLGKRVEIRTYPNASHAFMNETRPAGYDQPVAIEAWDQSMSFFKNCFLGL